MKSAALALALTRAAGASTPGSGAADRVEMRGPGARSQAGTDGNSVLREMRPGGGRLGRGWVGWHFQLLELVRDAASAKSLSFFLNFSFPSRKKCV